MMTLMTKIRTNLTPDPVELIYNYDEISSFTEVIMSKKIISVEIEKKGIIAAVPGYYNEFLF